MNVPNKYYGDLPSDATYGDGPFREVRLFVDGLLAGVVFPSVGHPFSIALALIVEVDIWSFSRVV